MQIINSALLILSIVRLHEITPNAAKATMQPEADAAAPTQANGSGAAWSVYSEKAMLRVRHY
jgi:hypothetical protein